MDVSNTLFCIFNYGNLYEVGVLLVKPEFVVLLLKLDVIKLFLAGN